MGSKKGELHLVSTNSFEVIQTIEKAHESEIWNIYPIKYSYIDTKYRILTGSSDKTIKYWNIDYKGNSEQIISHYKTIDVIEQITYSMLSPDYKYLVYSLLDNSIRIFYEDSNKFFLSLYGHKLPVLSFDISSDGTLLISGSADKNIRLWGMDFGDCHKSFFAHLDSVTCVKFVKGTHYFFSCSKDKAVRYWDADSVRIT
jgi:U3 small nucleolar RNA-associated protein 12